MKTNKITSFVGFKGCIIIGLLSDDITTKIIFTVFTVVYFVLYIISDE